MTALSFPATLPSVLTSYVLVVQWIERWPPKPEIEVRIFTGTPQYMSKEKTSLCPHPDVCGSCGWSHIPYDKQLKQKISDINGSFAIKELSCQASEIIPSPKTAHYRNRMDFVIDWQGNIGLREQGKWWRVIDDHPCFLADENIDTLFAVCRNWAKTCGLSFYDRKANVGMLRYAVIRSTTLGQTMVTIVTSAPANKNERKKVAEALQLLTPSPTTLLWAINHTSSDVSHGGENIIISGPGYIEEEISGTRYRISPNAFFQTNPHAAPYLLSVVKDFLGDLSGKKFLDLYCGTGFFSLALAGKAKETIGIELVEDAIKDAQANAEINGIADKVTYIAKPTENVDWLSYNADVVLLDPPRAGLHPSTLEELTKPNAPEHVVYVSCNYKNLARELVTLQNFYEITDIKAVDMFPHTPHVEVVADLKKKSRS